jgi:hypothetical protein
LCLVVGAAVPVVLIPRPSIAQAPTSVLEGVVTDGAGTFRLAHLPVGTYDIRVRSAGFSDSVQHSIVLTIGQTVHLTTRLVPAGVVETVG